MSKYTTGELARLCGVSVRTVQYYDTRNILSPSELSEGGRRLYSEDDLKTMRVICILREIGLPLNVIGQLLSESDPGSVIHLLLDQQAQVLREEIGERQTKLQLLEELQQQIKNTERFSVNSISDIAYQMENKKKLRKVYTTLLAVGIPAELLEIATAVLWWQTGIWWPFAVCMCAVIAACIWVSVYYYRNVAYICPQCHATFRTSFKEMFWAPHTPKTRKLTCPHCSHKGFCVEIYNDDPS